MDGHSWGICHFGISLGLRIHHLIGNTRLGMDIGDPILGILDSPGIHGSLGIHGSIPNGQSSLVAVALKIHSVMILVDFGLVVGYPDMVVFLILLDVVVLNLLDILMVVVLVADRLVDDCCISGRRSAFLVDSLIPWSLIWFLISCFLSPLQYGCCSLDGVLVGSMSENLICGLGRRKSCGGYGSGS